jgi:NAD(P)-dependent dehydrogenase (short-subunit alcohol dehydrogenase family)
MVLFLETSVLGMDLLEGRTAIVTGAASGIGLAVATALSTEGMRVVLADLAGDRLDAAVAALAGVGADVHAVDVDVRDPDSVDRAGRVAVERFGALHVAVNNAGIVNRGRSWELSLDEWRDVLDVDLWGVIHGVRSFVPLILDTGSDGHVVNVASMAAVLPQDRLGPYTVAKHGVLGLSDVLRAELLAIDAPVGVSVVMPGRVRTAMNPIGSIAPESVAVAIVDAIRRDRPYVFTDDHATTEVAARLRAILDARPGPPA